MTLYLEFIIIVLLPAQVFCIFCSSICFDSTSCSGILTTDCTACSVPLFNSVPSATACIANTQQNETSSVILHDLTGNPVNVNNGFIGNNLVLFTCGIYNLPGRFVANQYMSKRYSGLDQANHYEAVIRFNIAYIGTWAASDKNHLTVFSSDSDTTGVVYNWTYSCPHIQNLCLSVNDCLNTKQFVIKHNSSALIVNFTTSIVQTNPTIQFWSIRDLIVAIKKCHTSCTSCYGGSQAECFVCASGYYLLGNYCTKECPFYYIPAQKKCVESCPIKFYLNSVTSICQPCQNGCSLCSNNRSCIVYDTDNPQSSRNTAFYQKIQLWIFLIILCCTLVLITLYYIFCRPKVTAHEDNQISNITKGLQQTIDNILGSNIKRKFNNHASLQTEEDIKQTRQQTHGQSKIRNQQPKRNSRYKNTQTIEIQNLDETKDIDQLKYRADRQKNTKFQQKGF